MLFYITQNKNSKDLLYMSRFTLFSLIFTDQAQKTQFQKEWGCPHAEQWGHDGSPKPLLSLLQFVLGKSSVQTTGYLPEGVWEPKHSTQGPAARAPASSDTVPL